MPAANPQLKRRIMRRVYTVWFFRQVAPALAVELVLLLGVAAGVLAVISPKQILLNALQASAGTREFVQFFIDNFFVKSVQSRLLAAVYVAVASFFVRDLRRALRRLKTSGGVLIAVPLPVSGERSAR